MPHDDAPGTRPTRRALIRTGAAVAVAGTLGVRARPFGQARYGGQGE